MKSNERSYVWYRPGEEGEIVGVGTVLVPHLEVASGSGGRGATGNAFELQILEVDLAQ